MIGPKEFADHPESVRCDPAEHGQIVKQLGAYMPSLAADYDCQQEGGNKHGHTEQPKFHRPAHVLEQPEYNVRVFGEPESFGNRIEVVSNLSRVSQGRTPFEKAGLLNRINRIRNRNNTFRVQSCLSIA